MEPRVLVRVEALREVTPPTAAQRARFVEHLCGAHSWYKAYRTSVPRVHFAIFLWSGSDFAPQHRGSENYRELHGFLFYGWGSEGSSLFRSDVDEIELEPPLAAAGGVVVEPYISSRGDVTTKCIADQDPRCIATHPRREALEQLVAYREEQARLWEALPNENRDALVEASVHGHPLPPDPGIARYAEVKRRLLMAYKALRDEEVAKIEAAIDRILALREAVM